MHFDGSDILGCRGQLKCDDGTRTETRFRLSRETGTSPFKSAGGGRQFSRLLAAEVCGISGSNAGYTVFRGSVKGTGCIPLKNQYQRTQSHPTAVTGRNTKGPSLTTLL